MLAKLSVDQVLMKARSHAKKGEVLESQKLYQSVLLAFPKNKRAQDGLNALNKHKQNNSADNPPNEQIDQLINLYNQGQLADVVEQSQELTKQYPNSFIIWNILGASTAQMGMIDDAIEAYKNCISLNPNYAEAHNNLGVVLKAQGKLEEAVVLYNKSIALNSNYAEAHTNLGNALQDQGKLDEAVEVYKKSILLEPNYSETYNNLGLILHDQSKLNEAIDVYKKSISVKPDNAEAYINMGNVFKDQGRLDEAIAVFKKSLSIKSNYAEAYSNMGNALQDQGKPDEAIESYKEAIKIKPDYAEAHLYLALTFLNCNKLKEGFNEYEWRWKTAKGLARQRHFQQPIWDGNESLKDKTILLWSEQGIGDTMIWSSCLPFVTNLARHVIVECQEKLVPLLSRSFPNVEIKAENRSLDTERKDFDLHLPMGSLYKHFINEILEKNKVDAYLVPDPLRVKYWKERLNLLGKGPYVGICWKSSVKSAYRLQHYPPIYEWSPILKIPGVKFINLQYENFEDDIAKVKEEFGVKIHHFDDLDQYGNIDEVAALCSALDMVVSTKVTPPFISSAVGTPTKIANWRQSSFNNILTNPATSSFDMYHRNTWEPWDNVFNLISDDIINLKNEISYSNAKMKEN